MIRAKIKGEGPWTTIGERRHGLALLAPATQHDRILSAFDDLANGAGGSTLWPPPAHESQRHPPLVLAPVPPPKSGEETT